jgi:hypothetical protein
VRDDGQAVTVKGRSHGSGVDLARIGGGLVKGFAGQEPLGDGNHDAGRCCRLAVLDGIRRRGKRLTRK